MAYSLSLLLKSAWPTTALQWPDAIVSRCIALDTRALAIRRFSLITRPRAAGEEPPTEATFVGCVTATFDRNATWASYIGCFRALREINEGGGEMLKQTKLQPHYKFHQTDFAVLVLSRSCLQYHLRQLFDSKFNLFPHKILCFLQQAKGRENTSFMKSLPHINKMVPWIVDNSLSHCIFP